MLRQTGSKVCIFALAFAALVVAKPPPSAGPCATYGKPVFSRALGPPFGAPAISSITVPYKPKSSPLFPKFVDPTTVISKKTDLLSNLFGGLGPASSGALPVNAPKYPPGFMPSSPVLYTSGDVDETPETKQVKEVNEVAGTITKDKIKRGAVAAAASKPSSPKLSSLSSPFAPKFFPFAPSFSPFAPSFFPFAPNFSPFAPGYSPLAASFPSTGPATNYAPGLRVDGGASSSRRRRSIVESEGDLPKALGPPPAYPGLAPIAEEPESLESKFLKLYDPSTAPKETLPGLFGPFGPFSPYAAAPIDPSIFAPKMPTFPDSVNSPTTPSPDAEALPVTEVPVPKSTIVPPGFWAPSSIIPGPTEYADKVSTFLDKLFSSLVLNKTATASGAGKTVLARALVEDPVKGKALVSRSIEDIKNIAAAKDTIVDSIVSELGDLKADIVDTLNDYIVYQKSLPVPKAPKKASKPFPFAAFFAPPTPDPSLPFKQRIDVLSQVFDMLSGLQKNISGAVQEAIKNSTDAPVGQETKIVQEDVDDVTNDVIEDPNSVAIAAFNATLLDAIKCRLAALDKSAGAGFNKPYGSPIYAAPVKRGLEDQDYLDHEIYENQREDNRDQYKRAVQMQMHQGYQSMPPGTVESVQAGGGAVPGHQGGGIKLLGSQVSDEDSRKWSEWAEYFKNKYEGRKHHHNHH